MWWFELEMIFKIPSKRLCESVLEELSSPRNSCWSREKGPRAAGTGMVPSSLVLLELRTLLPRLHLSSLAVPGASPCPLGCLISTAAPPCARAHSSCTRAVLAWGHSPNPNNSTQRLFAQAANTKQAAMTSHYKLIGCFRINDYFTSLSKAGRPERGTENKR